MPTLLSRRCPGRGRACLQQSALLCLVFLSSAAFAQSPASSPASVPAGAEGLAAAKGRPSVSEAIRPSISSKQAREAEDAYLQGAKDVDHKDLAAAEKSFARAVQLNPGYRDYALALAVTREHHLTDLVQAAAKARLMGKTAQADALLGQARAIDPDNPIVAQHFGLQVAAWPERINPLNPLGEFNASDLSGPVELAPQPGTRDLHLQGPPQEVIRSLYSTFGIAVTFDPSVTGGSPVQLDIAHVSFADAARVVADLTHTFAVPVQPRSALVAADTEENRSRLVPQIEQTVYIPGLPAEAMTEMANLARNIFGLTSVTASSSTDTIVLRGDQQTLQALDATYATMLTGGSDVQLDINLYEIDRTNTRNIGLQLPSSAGAFSIAAEAQQLVSANQSIIDQAIAAGLIKLTGNSVTDLITEAGFLIASGAVSASQFTNLLGIFGNGLTLGGLYVSSGATVNLLLNSSDARMLDAVKLRSGDNQAATFRAGTRYPIITSTYTSGISSSLASSVAGININGTNVGSLLQQYLGTSSVTVPQIQFEDLGLTLKATPQILHGGSVQLKLDMKIESLGAGSLNSIPVLNNRQLTSTVTVAAGQTALMASQVSTTETRDIQGIPGLGELPGFQDTTNRSTEKDTGELLITVTPHIVRQGYLRIASRALSVPRSAGSGSSFEAPAGVVPAQPAVPPSRPPTAPRTTPTQPATAPVAPSTNLSTTPIGSPLSTTPIGSPMTTTPIGSPSAPSDVPPHH